MEWIQLGIAIVSLVLFTPFGAAVMWAVFSGRIDLKYLLSDAEGDASMSRFQLLVFTFAVAMSLMYMVMAPGSEGFPEIPGSVLTLLGISGSSYLVGKSLDRASEDSEDEPAATKQKPAAQRKAE